MKKMKEMRFTVMNIGLYIYTMTMMPTMTTMMDTTYLTDTTMMTTETVALDSYNLIGFPIVQDFNTVKGFKN